MSRHLLVINPGADVYGSDLQMLESVTAARQAGWRVTVITPEKGPLHERVITEGGQPIVFPLPVVRRAHLRPKAFIGLLRTLPTAIIRLRAEIRSLDADLVYVNTTTIPWAIAAARAARIPVVCHVHEAEDTDARLVLLGLNAPLMLADRLIFISKTARAAATSIVSGLGRRGTLVSNGVPDRPVPPVAPPDGVPTRLCVLGRLSPRKAPHVAIETLRVLRDRGVPARLEVAGSAFPGYEFYEQELRDSVQEWGLTDSVEFSGYVSPSYTAFDRAQIVLCPSLREPFGNAVIEAQLAQRPVIAAAAAGHLESIADGKTGLLVPAGDPVAMAEAVVRLIEDPALSNAISLAARTSAMQYFGLDRYRRQIIEILDAMTTTSSRATA